MNETADSLVVTAETGDGSHEGFRGVEDLTFSFLFLLLFRQNPAEGMRKIKRKENERGQTAPPVYSRRQ
jgi:hypothetical protein